MNLIQQKSSDKLWYDETGQSIPYNRITKAERSNERDSARLLKLAKSANSKLSELKVLMKELSEKAFFAAMSEKGIDDPKTKGNFTWYNFNRTIKIEVSISEPIKFDDLTIAAAKEKFDQFLDTNISSENEFVKEMILDAFETKRTNQLDTGLVLRLSRYESKVQSPLFTEAVKLVNQAIRRPKSKPYYRIWLKNQETGEYDNIDLNISSI